jgi:hypothetical protein
MTSFVKSAKYVHDVESDLSYVEIVYDRYMKGKGYDTFTDYINTKPLGDWTATQYQQRRDPNPLAYKPSPFHPCNNLNSFVTYILLVANL